MQVTEKIPILEGTLDVITLLDLMQVLSLGRQYTSIELHSSDGELVGALAIKSGMLLDARTASGEGRDAFFGLLSEPRAEKFNVFRLPPHRAGSNPLGRLDSLMLESVSAARRPASRPWRAQDARPKPKATPHTGRTLAAQVPQAHAPAAPGLPTLPGQPSQPQAVPARLSQPSQPEPVSSPSRPRPAPAPASQALRPQAPPPAVDQAPRRVPDPPASSPVPRSPRPNCRVVAVSSPKGGVGKTTVALNLGVALAERGTSVVLVDGDPQGGLGFSLTERVRQAQGVRDVLEGRKRVAECAIQTRVATLKILPAGLWGDEPAGGQSLANTETWSRLLDEATRGAEVVLVDTAAGLSSITTSVLEACDDVLGVVQAEVLSVRSFPALLRFLERYAPEGRPRLGGVVVNMFQHDQATSHTALHDALRSLPPDLVLQPVIPRDGVLLEATASGTPLKFLGQGAPAALTQAFDSLAAELAMRLSLDAEPRQKPMPFVD